MNEKVIHPSSIALRIRVIVEESSVRLLLISPYFDPWKSLQKSILVAVKRGVECMIIIRSDEKIKESVRNIFIFYFGINYQIDVS